MTRRVQSNQGEDGDVEDATGDVADSIGVVNVDVDGASGSQPSEK